MTYNHKNCPTGRSRLIVVWRNRAAGAWAFAENRRMSTTFCKDTLESALS
jgi:hypothetical protein